MLSAKDVMTRDPVVAHPFDDLEAAARLMLRHAISGLPVVDIDGHVAGIITEYELIELVRTSAVAREPVERHMTFPVWTVGANEPVERVVELMRAHRIRRVPVVADGRLVGLIARRDLLRIGCALVERRQQQEWLSTLLGSSRD